MGTVIQDAQSGKAARTQRWDRTQRAERLDMSRDLQAQGVSQRQAAKALDVPHTTLPAWRAWQDSIDACPRVVEFFDGVLGLAFLHRLVMAFHVVFVESGAGGIRLVCLFVQMTGLNRFVGASCGAQQRINLGVEAAMVAYTREETQRLADSRAPQAITVAQDATFTAGLCWVAIEPVSNSMLVAHPAEARDHDTGKTLMTDTRAPLKGHVLQSTSDEASGLLAYVEQHLGAPHSPDLFHVQQELSKAVAVPMAITQRAAAQAVAQAEETRKRMHEPLDNATTTPAKRGPGRPPKVTGSLEQVAQDVGAARHEHQRLAGQREIVTQSIRAIGHADHLVALERGVRRNGQRLAGDIQRHIDTIRTMAQHEHLSTTCLERIAKAERVVPTMQATIEFVSGSVRRQVTQLELAPSLSFAMHARRIPAYSLDRVASTRTVREGASLRALAERLRIPLFTPAGAFGALSPMEQDQLKAKAKPLADVFQRSSSNVEGRNGYLALRNHQLRGLDHPRKRACLTAVHNFLLTHPDGTTAAERFFGQKPRSMFTAILESVEIPLAPLSPPQRAVG